MIRICFIIVVSVLNFAVVVGQKNFVEVRGEQEAAAAATTENVVEWLAAFPPYEQVVAQLFASLPDDELPLPQDWFLDRHPDGWRLRARALEQAQRWVWLAETKAFAETLTEPVEWPVTNPDFRREAYAAWTSPERAAPYSLRVFVGYLAANRHTMQWVQLPGEWPPALLQALGLASLDEARRLLEPPAVSKAAEALAQPAFPPDSIDLAEACLRKAVDAYRRLNASRPDYSAVEGRPVLALDLALAESWSLLERSGHAARGKVFLDQVQFSPFYTAYGRNLLQGLPDSAVLLCSNRLEALLTRVIQFREKLRMDVQIVDGQGQAAAEIKAEDQAFARPNQPFAIAPPPDSVLSPWVSEGLFARWRPSPDDKNDRHAVDLSEPQRALAAQLRAQLYTDRFRFPAVTPSLNLDPTAVAIAHRYRRSAMETAQTLDAAGQPEEGLRLLNVLYRHLPEWVIPMHLADLPVVVYYYQHGAAERAGEMGMALAKRLSGLRQTDAEAALALETLTLLAQENSQVELLQYYERLLE
ncbi:MAG: hypothetical protein GC205_08890 [Bacteroidetes bacterium]|nr:hypothetical protein [Bacteroidota bacterium]